MNSTLLIKSSNSSQLIYQSWFIPIDILNILCTTLAITISSVLLFILIMNKTCHNVSMLISALRTFLSDLQQAQYNDVFCIFLAYISNVSGALFNTSFLLQALYRYFIVIYRNRAFLRSIRFQFLLICLTWLYSFLHTIPSIYSGETYFNADNQLCQIYLRFSYSIIVETLCIHIIPVSLIMLMYFKLVRYVRRMKNCVTPVNTLNRAKRELKMVQHTVLLVVVLIIVGFPYAVFIVMSFFTAPPKYHFRIAYTFIDVAFLLAMIILFYFTKPFKKSMI